MMPEAEHDVAEPALWGLSRRVEVLEATIERLGRMVVTGKIVVSDEDGSAELVLLADDRSPRLSSHNSSLTFTLDRKWGIRPTEVEASASAFWNRSDGRAESGYEPNIVRAGRWALYASLEANTTPVVPSTNVTTKLNWEGGYVGDPGRTSGPPRTTWVSGGSVNTAHT